MNTGAWYCARFGAMSDVVVVLQAYRATLGGDVPMFVARDAWNGDVLVYLPAMAKRFVAIANREGVLPPFEDCERPPAERVELLLGDPADFAGTSDRGDGARAST